MMMILASLPPHQHEDRSSDFSRTSFAGVTDSLGALLRIPTASDTEPVSLHGCRHVGDKGSRDPVLVRRKGMSVDFNAFCRFRHLAAPGDWASVIKGACGNPPYTSGASMPIMPSIK